MAVMRNVSLMVVALLLGCAPRPSSTPEPDAAGTDAAITSSLVVRLSQDRLDVVNGVPATANIEVLLQTSDGRTMDVTSASTFGVFPNQLGNAASGVLTASGLRAGAGNVSVEYLGLGGQAAFTVHINSVLPGTAAATTAQLFDAATLDTATTFPIVYPPADAVIPPNLGEMEVHWIDAANHDVYELSFESAFVQFKTYVNRLGTNNYNVLTPAQWALLGQGSPGPSNVRVRGLSTAAPATYVQSEETITIASSEVKGGIYYWNTNEAAIMRYDMTTQAAPPARFYPATATGECVGCHAVSRDGTVVAYRQGGGNLNYGNSLKVEGLQKQIAQDTVQWNFAAIHPNNTDMFITDQSGIARVDLATGVSAPLYTAARMAQPDVSADGKTIVAVEVRGGSEVYSTAGRIVAFDYDTTGKTVGAPRVVAEPAAGAHLFYPSISPDGKWVLYNQATGGNSYDNPQAQLWVTKLDGSIAPFRLTQVDMPASYNSWPKWTPFAAQETSTTANGEPIMWFTFASRRPFGVRSPGAQKPQLWMAPFFPNRDAASQSVSAAAVRLPFQNLAQGNHIAQWAEAIVAVD